VSSSLRVHSSKNVASRTYNNITSVEMIMQWQHMILLVTLVVPADSLISKIGPIGNRPLAVVDEAYWDEVIRQKEAEKAARIEYLIEDEDIGQWAATVQSHVKDIRNLDPTGANSPITDMIKAGGFNFDPGAGLTKEQIDIVAHGNANQAQVKPDLSKQSYDDIDYHSGSYNGDGTGGTTSQDTDCVGIDTESHPECAGEHPGDDALEHPGDVPLDLPLNHPGDVMMKPIPKPIPQPILEPPLFAKSEEIPDSRPDVVRTDENIPPPTIVVWPADKDPQECESPNCLTCQHDSGGCCAGATKKIQCCIDYFYLGIDFCPDQEGF